MIGHFDARIFFLNRILPIPPNVTLTTRKVSVSALFPLFQRAVIKLCVDWLRNQLLLFPRLQQSLWGNIHGADLGKCLKVPEFQFKKKRLMFVQLLDADSQTAEASQDAKDSQDTKGLSTELTRPVADTVLSKQDERSILTYLDTFKKEDKGIISRVLGFFRSSSGEEELWQSARNRARSTSDSQFLSELKDIPADHYLHVAAADIEETAYDLLKKQVSLSVSAINRQIRSTQNTEREKQVQEEVDIEEDREVQEVWLNFVHQIKDRSTERYTPYVPPNARNGLIT
jgi:hypothetical protein